MIAAIRGVTLDPTYQLMLADMKVEGYAAVLIAVSGGKIIAKGIGPFTTEDALTALFSLPPNSLMAFASLDPKPLVEKPKTVLTLVKE